MFALVKRDGNVRSFHVERVTAENLEHALWQNVHQSATVMTDGFSSYDNLGHMFGYHRTVNHSAGEYSRKEKGLPTIHTNTIEGVFSILKRGIYGTYHQIGKHHLHRYLSEFDFRYNSRQLTDGQRTDMALNQAAGKRLMLRES